MRSAIYVPIFSSIPLPLLSSVAHCSLLLLLLLLLLLFLSLLTYLLTYSLTANTSSLSLSLSLSLSPFFTYFGCCFLWLFTPPSLLVCFCCCCCCWGWWWYPLPGPTLYNNQTNKQTTSSNCFPSSSFRLPSHSVC